eukprot:8695957-Alexandrium_andersonii.AAC.1
MSASLVGSEMCIRDSCGKEDRGWLAARPAFGIVAASGWFLRVLDMDSICLLYTSDAADDM